MALPGTSGRHRIYLMRHGEVSYFDADGKPVNPKTVSLTERGTHQAQAARDALAAVPFDRVLCSGLPRAQQTAEIVVEGRGLTVDEDPDLGELRGGRFADIPRERWEAEFVYGFENATAPGASFAGGESYADFEHRVVGGLTRFFDAPGWTRALIVAHDGVNRMILSWACGAGLAALSTFEQDMGCINIIDVDIADGALIRRMIKAVNLTIYDPPKQHLPLTSMEQVLATLERYLGAKS